MTISVSPSLSAPLATYPTNGHAARSRAFAVSLPPQPAIMQQAAVGAAALKPPRTLMTLLKTVGILGAVGGAIGFA
ncbi:MAG: hypothetical protein H7123_06940, partial [Thermoleophilia bacterium]|nr:hypothetical protein [Thermoleophilia bacterium]